MATPLRLLIAEDSPTDAAVVLEEVRQAGFDPQWRRVDNRADFVQALGEDYDLVLSDFGMGEFDGLQALDLLRARPLDTPFIVVSGSIGEEMAFALVRKGATDYVSKEHLGGLGRAMTRALREHAVQRERRHAERALRASEERFRAVVENIQDIITVVDAQGAITMVTPSVERLLGQLVADLEGQPVSAWMHPDDGETLRGALAAGAEAAGLDRPMEVRLRHREQRWCWFEVVGRNLLGRPAVGSWVLVWRDLAQRKEMEGRFLRAQRMEGIGTLASGIAHDLNNIFAPITMATQVLQLQRPEPEAQNLLATIENSARRGAEIVRQVLTFAHGLEGERLLIQPRHLLKEMARVAKETFPKTIQIHRRLPDDLWTVSGDPTHLRQVLMNLCVNARDAMPGGGALWLTAANRVLDDYEASQIPDARPGSYVVLEVADTGTGIPPAIVDKIFEPFFTTKEPGKGAGLGLSSVLGIVRSHQGFLQVQSDLSKGTAVRVFLPALPSNLPAAVPLEIQKSPAPRGHGETILVADDEAGIRDATRELLSLHGYEVLVAEDGTEAVAMFALRRDAIRLVLTDVVMPFMDGIALTRALRKIDPELRVIAMSGMAGIFEEGDRATELRQLKVEEFLQKPFNADTLLQTVHRVLHQPC